MDKAGPVILVVVIAVTAAVAIGLLIVQSSKRMRALQETYARLAKHFGGHSLPGSLGQRPSLHFTHRGGAILVNTLRVGGKHPRYYLQFHAPWPGLDRHGAALQMAVYPESVLATVGKWLGVRDIDIGDRKFDNRYTVSGSDEDAIRAISSPAARAVIDRLRLLDFNDDIHVSLGGGQLTVKKLGCSHSYDAIAEFVAISLKLYDLVLGADSEGIKFLEPLGGDKKTPANRDWACQVCGEPIDSEIVFCRSCQTPHHRDCWSYNGVCSIYGCGETSFEASHMVNL